MPTQRRASVNESAASLLFANLIQRIRKQLKNDPAYQGAIQKKGRYPSIVAYRTLAVNGFITRELLDSLGINENIVIADFRQNRRFKMTNLNEHEKLVTPNDAQYTVLTREELFEIILEDASTPWASRNGAIGQIYKKLYLNFEKAREQKSIE